MGVNRIVPNLPATDTHVSQEFYAEHLGLELVLDLGWIVTYRSPDNPTAQVSVITRDETAPEDSTISIGVSDVDEAYAEAQNRRYEIVHPLTEEPWGVRRFFVRDPNGVVVNVVAHA
jgi:catechol 2,3-dioxygenase-like lactoylglutathione lyase family enzyme